MLLAMERTTAFHEWIRARYKEASQSDADLSPTKFGEMVGVNHLTILGWLEDTKKPQRKTVRRMAAYFGVDEADLLAMAGYGPAAGEDLDDLGDVIERPTGARVRKPMASDDLTRQRILAETREALLSALKRLDEIEGKG